METDTRDDGRVIRWTFDSLDELVDYAQEHEDAIPDRRKSARSWNHNADWDETMKLARYGWDKGLTEALPIAEQAVDAIEAETEALRPEPEYHYYGTRVNVGRAIAGHPKAMVRYQEQPTSKAGSVVTLCASVSVSGSVKADNLIERGSAVVALALALERSGHATELWVTFDSYESNGYRFETRVKLKDAHDVLDAERIAFAYSHPAMLRNLMLGIMHKLPKQHQRSLNVGMGYGKPGPAHQDMRDGTVYLPELKTGKGTTDPQKLIRQKLRSLGILDE